LNFRRITTSHAPEDRTVAAYLAELAAQARRQRRTPQRVGDPRARAPRRRLIVRTELAPDHN
jgi:hypothetical protein